MLLKFLTDYGYNHSRNHQSALKVSKGHPLKVSYAFYYFNWLKLSTQTEDLNYIELIPAENSTNQQSFIKLGFMPTSFIGLFLMGFRKMKPIIVRYISKKSIK